MLTRLKRICFIGLLVVLSGASNIALSIGDEYVDSGANCFDEVDGDLSSIIQVSGLEAVDTQFAEDAAE